MAKIKRILFPGDEWLFIKIYTGINTADMLLVDVVPTMVSGMKHNGLIDNWFFIRYTDPDFHIRLRFHLTDVMHLGCVLTRVRKRLSPLVADHLISSIVIDTYVREVERYGAAAMERSEQIFGIDSECVCSLVNKARNHNADFRWQCAVLLIDGMLDAFSIPLHDKSMMIEQLCNGYKQEFGYNEHNSKQLNESYRKYRQSIEHLLQHDMVNNVIYDAEMVINKRNTRIKAIASLGKRSYYNYSALLHMCMNRLFASQGRLNELVLYTFLSKAYKSMLIRQNQNMKPP